jgi:hypothetical protein
VVIWLPYGSSTNPSWCRLQPDPAQSIRFRS